MVITAFCVARSGVVRRENLRQKQFNWNLWDSTCRLKRYRSCTGFDRWLSKAASPRIKPAPKKRAEGLFGLLESFACPCCVF
jgi:hypothetical protein